MDFVSYLPRSWIQFDLVWVIVDRITKLAHFLPVRTNFSVKDYERLNLDEILKLHRVPVLIISNRGM